MPATAKAVSFDDVDFDVPRRMAADARQQPSSGNTRSAMLFTTGSAPYWYVYRAGGRAIIADLNGKRVTHPQ